MFFILVAVLAMDMQRIRIYWTGNVNLKNRTEFQCFVEHSIASLLYGKDLGIYYLGQSGACINLINEALSLTILVINENMDSIF